VLEVNPGLLELLHLIVGELDVEDGHAPGRPAPP
jgi:hypothetical protein